MWHYDSNKHRLLPAFFQALGISSPQLSPISGELANINRSLTRCERDLLRWINQNHPSPFYQELLNSGLQRAESDAKPEAPEIPPKISEALRGIFGDEIDWINQTFFGCQPVAGFGAVLDPGTRTSPTDMEAARSLAVHRLALGLVLERAEIHSQILDRIRSLDRENQSDPGVPKDFDPVGYLVRNPDLIKSKFPIIHHYLRYGKLEGRQYR